MYFAKYVNAIATRKVYRKTCLLIGRETKKVNYRNKNVEIIGRKHTTYGIGKTKPTRFRNTRQTFPIFFICIVLITIFFFFKTRTAIDVFTCNVTERNDWNNTI